VFSWDALLVWNSGEDSDYVTLALYQTQMYSLQSSTWIGASYHLCCLPYYGELGTPGTDEPLGMNPHAAGV
jgi:hypothetical protein